LSFYYDTAKLFQADKLHHTNKQGRSQDFSKGGAEVIEAKCVEKENLLVIRIAKEKLGILPTKLPSCFFDILS